MNTLQNIENESTRLLQAVWLDNRNTDEANYEITELVSNLRMQLQSAYKTIESISAARMAQIESNITK